MSLAAKAQARWAISLAGVVQGVGLRPLLYRLAGEHGLSGWARNEAAGVRVEVQGKKEDLTAFVEALRSEAPPGAAIREVEIREAPLSPGERGFHLVESGPGERPRSSLPPDSAPCEACIREMESPGERRSRYPFTNCAHCGPRYTIVLGLPYDRARTTLKGFPLCAACAREHGDPADRRFHAQPIACPACGPRLAALAPDGRELATGEAALAIAAFALGRGEVCAALGVGGFQLLADATSADAIALLRRRKARAEKPFAVMFPSLESLRAACAVSAAEEEALGSQAAPIVLVRRTGARLVAAGVAPGSPWIGAMLPSTPMHRLLLSGAARPLVCTSGNLSTEPLCTSVEEGLSRLQGLADVFLVHDRPVARPVDDSVARVGPTGLQLLRRARGYVPGAIPRREAAPVVLALGAHLKSTVALAAGHEVLVSQHLGDLDSPLATALLERTALDLLRFLDARPDVIACDLHPEYASTRLAERLSARFGVPIERVQHHHAHVAAGMAEHDLEGPVLGLAWDGIGHGTDGVLWGGEALRCEGARARRTAHLRPFPLPGGEVAIREPRRAAAGLLHAMLGAGFAERVSGFFGAEELRVLRAMLDRRVNTPLTTSVGRLFDAIAALAGVRLKCTFEGQAAMELEALADDAGDVEPYPFPLSGDEALIADWEPLVRGVLDDRAGGAPASVVSARLHASLASLAGSIAERAEVASVVLSGGCFQNLRLATSTRATLERRGFTVYTPARFPPNDGGISLGQACIAARRRQGS